MTTTWFDKYITKVDERQATLNQGIPTLVPFVGFPRFSEIIPGIIPGDNVIITAETGGMKSRITRFFFIKNMINYGRRNGMDVKIFLNSLEEPVEKVVSSFISTELYKKYNLDTNYYQLNNFSEKPMSKDFRQKLEDCKPKIDILQNYLDITQIPNPYGFFLHVMKWLYKNGTFLNKKQEQISWESVKTDSKLWDTYVPNKPTLVIAIQDTIDAVLAENGKTQYQTILDYTKFFARTLMGMRCGVINVWVQQQSPELERIQTNVAGKTIIDKLKPGLDTLLACKATQQSATLAFGIFDPAKYGEYVYGGYNDIRQFNGEFRTLILLKGREGARKKGTEIPIIAYPSRDEFFELPKPIDPALKQYLK